jgi:hypothetical protein
VSFFDNVTGGWVIAIILFAVALSATWFTEETFGKELVFWRSNVLDGVLKL